MKDYVSSLSNSLFPIYFQASKEHDSVTNRVAGFICRHVFTGHSSCVTGLAAVGRQAGFNSTYLVYNIEDSLVEVHSEWLQFLLIRFLFFLLFLFIQISAGWDRRIFLWDLEAAK